MGSKTADINEIASTLAGTSISDDDFVKIAEYFLKLRNILCPNNTQ